VKEFTYAEILWLVVKCDFFLLEGNLIRIYLTKKVEDKMKNLFLVLHMWVL